MSQANDALRDHWPEYLIEAAGLGLFMISAGTIATLLEYPQSAVHNAIPDPLARRALMGLAMGLTLVGLIYSPWGRQSGAHFNPAVTLTFFRLGKVAPWDAEAPLSGTSLNPARTVASALPSGDWNGAWIYMAAPLLGMLLAVDAYRLITRDAIVMCAKLNHITHRRCIFQGCGFKQRAIDVPRLVEEHTGP